MIAKTPPTAWISAKAMIGMADLIEEVARMYGYDNIPATRLADELPAAARQRAGWKAKRTVRDHAGQPGPAGGHDLPPDLAWTRSRVYPPGSEPADAQYVRLENPIASDRAVMRRSLLASVLEIVERNIRLRDRLALFEIGPVFLPSPERPAAR